MSAAPTDWFTARAMLSQIDVLADTLARIRRRADGDDYSVHLCDRASAAVDALDAMLRPTAAELVQAGVDPPQALETVDSYKHRLRLV